MGKKRTDYSALERKIYTKVALLCASAFSIAFLMSVFAKNYKAGDFILSVLRRVFGMAREDSVRFYYQYFRSNLEFLLFATALVFFVILSRFLMSQFAKYFNEINGGLDTLAGEKDDVIELSPEMASMEYKLTAIRQALEKREREAKSAEQRKNDLVMYLAHDIRTPLTSVIGYLNLLNESPDIPREQRLNYTNIALDKANRLEGLVSEFFDITRYSFQSGAIMKKPIDLCLMLAQITDELYPPLAAGGKEIAVDVPEGLTIYGDPDKLARVFNNVLKNAVSYGEPGGTIEVTASDSGGAVTVFISNPGYIPENKIASIFEKFYRLDSARSPDTGGAGLGLAIAKEIAAAHGGDIRAESGGGKVVFTVELPSR